MKTIKSLRRLGNCSSFKIHGTIVEHQKHEIARLKLVLKAQILARCGGRSKKTLLYAFNTTNYMYMQLRLHKGGETEGACPYDPTSCNKTKKTVQTLYFLERPPAHKDFPFFRGISFDISLSSLTSNFTKH